MEVKETDQLFTDSPDSGHPACKCSRCGKTIQEHEVAMRVWPMEEDTEEMDGTEYRYCEQCQSQAGIISANGIHGTE